MREIASINEEENSFTTTTDGDTEFSIFDVTDTEAFVKKPEEKRDKTHDRNEHRKKTMPPFAMPEANAASNFPFNALSAFTSQIDVLEVKQEADAVSYGVKALKYLTDCLAGRNEVNGISTIDAAMLALLMMKESILQGKDNRKPY
jgi:hypothetical protein